MSDTSDEYAAFDFSEFTEEDLKQVDANLAYNCNGGPALPIEIEPSVESSTNIPSATADVNQKSDTSLSPLQEYRRNGILSVTDLASLAWCEVQFDYGLRQRRSRPLDMRPKSFISSQGKEIFVEATVAAKNDQITRKGKAIHKVLEREVRPEEIQVDVTSDEERWALRLVNMLACLRCVLVEGITREMPVFGVLHGEVVVGIIDEVVGRPRSMLPSASINNSTRSLPSSPRSKKRRRTPSPNHSLITKYLPELPIDPTVTNDLSDDAEQPLVPPLDITTIENIAYNLHLIDTKTRYTNSLPSDPDTLPSRIQLMLYRRLLGSLTSISPPFDFASLWKRLKLNPSKTFSTKFLVQAGLISENLYCPTCLDDLSNAWMETVLQFGVPKIDPVMQIIYRLQPQNDKWKRKNKRKTRAQNRNPSRHQEDIDLARAIEASLLDIPRTTEQKEAPDNVLVKSLQPKASTNGVPIPEAPLPSLLKENDVVDPLVFEAELPSADGEDATIDETTIIGTKEFRYDETILNDHLVNALQWWYGYRPPEGVSLRNSRRCSSCEYETNCEWREQKASEIAKQRQDKRREIEHK